MVAWNTHIPHVHRSSVHTKLLASLVLLQGLFEVTTCLVYSGKIECNLPVLGRK